VETKTGIKTTEFFVTIATLIAVLASSLADVLPARYAAIAGSIAAAGYSIARGLSKLGIKPETPAPPVPPVEPQIKK
jgi:hypothetical protein